MSEDKELLKIPARLAWTVIGVLLSAAISFNAVAVAAIYARPTEDRVVEMIIDKSPYKADKNLILKAITEASDNYRELKQAIDANTKAVIQLQATLKDN